MLSAIKNTRAMAGRLLTTKAAAQRVVAKTVFKASSRSGVSLLAI